MTDAIEPDPESVPPGTPPAAKFAFGRLMVNLAISSVAWMATVMFLIVVSRLVRTVAWLDGGPSVVVAALAAFLVAFVCHKRLPPLTSGWWVVVPMAVIPAGALTFLWLALVVSLELGSPITDCDWPGLEIEDCYGRDWGSGWMDTRSCECRGASIPRDAAGFRKAFPSDP